MVYQKYIKRLLDIFFSLLFIVLLSPLLLIIILIVRFNLGSPIIFIQERVGLKERVFKLYKFRSMTDESDESGELLDNELRMTKFSKIFRSTSLDELPELFNILKGEMSFIGPRPLLKEYLPYYDDRQRKRHLVRPGLTTYTAVNGRSSLSWEKRLEMDVWYVQNVTAWIDLKILIKTFYIVFKRENVSSDRGKFSKSTSEQEKDI